ncbi:chromate transporter [Armatimonas sp.]|uniref:chromate transporter n=1 Tax=Armatimonas sp. TaxID=1872638 RepID=UPI00286B389A|nr:chromate transporter [Armatimonas sp.]
MNLLLLFLLTLKASLFSTGGLGNVPSLHDDLIARGAVTERQLAEALAVGQVSPGPNGLWVVSLGYLLGGLPGALWTLAAISLPPLLILVVERLYRKVQEHPAVEGFIRGLALAVSGVFVVVLYRVLQGNGLDLQSVLIVAASFALGASKRVPVVVILALAALLGIVLR